jgi:tryptophan-rich sensory protein
MKSILLLVINIITPVLLAVGVNIFIYTNSWFKDLRKNQNAQSNNMLPPGYVVAIIWTLILALLGYAHYYLTFGFASMLVVFTIIYCILYPFLSFGFRSDRAKILNTISLILASLTLASSAEQRTWHAIFAIIPLFVWSSYVNMIDAVMVQSKH